jgi:hypothetical protein
MATMMTAFLLAAATRIATAAIVATASRFATASAVGAEQVEGEGLRSATHQTGRQYGGEQTIHHGRTPQKA